MFDIGWTEILILATICLFVIGPKDIPKFLGYVGKILAKIRFITSEFRESVDDAIKDSELEDIKKEISFSDTEISKDLNEALNPSTLHQKGVKEGNEAEDKKNIEKTSKITTVK